MLFELSEFYELKEFSFEWKGFTITKNIQKYNDLCSVIEIIGNNEAYRFTLQKDWPWSQIGQTRIIWKKERPYILHRNTEHHCVIKYKKDVWKDRYYTVSRYAEKLCKLLCLEPQINLHLDSLYPLLKSINKSCYAIRIVIDLYQPNLISTFSTKSLTEVIATTSTHTISTFRFDKNWIHLDHIYGSSLYLDGNVLKTIEGNYELPHCKKENVSFGQWLGEYYIVGHYLAKLFVPWKLDYVKYMSTHKRNIIMIILLCVKDKSLYKLVGPMIWKNIILPRIVFELKD